MKCKCGYEAYDDYEVNMIEMWDCARAIKKSDGFTNQLACCTKEGGKYYPPSPFKTDTEADAFKEQFIKTYDNKGNNNRPK